MLRHWCSTYRSYRRRETAFTLRQAAFVALGGVWLLVTAALSSWAPAGLSLDLLFLVPIAVAARYLPPGAVWYLAYSAGAMQFLSVAYPMGQQHRQPAGGYLQLLNLAMSAAQYLCVAHFALRLRQHVDRESKFASEDMLTGLMSRRAFNAVLSGALLASNRRVLPSNFLGALAYLDLDGFKAVNDRDGHDAGDEVLRLVASVLREVLRNEDCSARLGGDEFAVWLPGASEDDAISAMKRMLDALRERAAQKGWKIGASIGIVMVDSRDTDIATILQAADATMYEVKRNGKGMIRLRTSSVVAA